MFGVELIAGSLLASTIAFTRCENRPPPRLTSTVQAERPIYNDTKTHRELEHFNIDTVSPYDASAHSRISGLMSGNINVSMSANIAWSTNPITNQSCMWYENIQIKITSKPTIYVAAEHKNNRCRYNATVEHELKHVRVDEQLLREYKPRFEQAALNTARNIGVKGPFSSARVEQTRAEMNQIIQNAILDVLEDMKTHRRDAQQAIDSREEYDRLSRMCGGF